MCGEMLKDPTAPEVRLYAKTLSNLELSRGATVRDDMTTLLQQLVEVHTDERTRRNNALTLVDQTEICCDTLNASCLMAPLLILVGGKGSCLPSCSGEDVTSAGGLQRTGGGPQRECSPTARRQCRRYTPLFFKDIASLS